MSRKRRTYSNELKFKVVIEALKGQRQISEIASEFDVHPQQITNWKQQFLEQGASVFLKKPDNKTKELQDEQEELYKKIGQQQVELDWLKKNLKKLESWRNEK